MTGGVSVNPRIEAICKAIDTLTPSMETLELNGFHTSSMKICLRHKIPRCGKCMPPDNRELPLSKPYMHACLGCCQRGVIDEN